VTENKKTSKKITGKKTKKNLVVTSVMTTGSLILVMFTVLLLFIVHKVNSKMEIVYQNANQNLVKSEASAVSHWAREYINKTGVYTSADVVRTADENQIVSWLTAHKSRRPEGFEEVFFCGKDGIAHFDDGSVQNIQTDDAYTAILKKSSNVYVSDPLQSKQTGHRIFRVAKAVYDNYGMCFGFFGAGVNLTQIEENIASIRIGSDGFAFMLASDGTVMGHAVKEKIGNVNFVSGTEKEEMTMHSVGQAMVRGQSGTAYAEGNVEKQLITYTTVTGTPWSIALDVPVTQVRETADELALYIVLIALVIAIVLLTVSGLFFYHSLKPLHTVVKTVHGISQGNADLSLRIKVSTNNEIGAVINGFNSFVEKLQMIVNDIKNSKNTLIAVEGNLHESTQETTSSISRIFTTIRAVTNHISTQAESVEQTSSAVTEVARNITSLEKMIENQSAGVNQASAAVEQMIGNISSVNQSVEKMAESFGLLQKDAMSGSEKQQDVNDKVTQINNQSEMLQEANSAIAAIAEQTSLLAMNAAIEAAHAGAAGKGFSVVADEIRKLSETSSAQSRTIGEQLKKIQESIKSVVVASADSNSSFNSVSVRITETDGLVQQIKGAMQEQEEGSRQIRSALTVMNDSTAEVRTASKEMSEGNKAILTGIEQLQNATNAIKDSMQEMTDGVQQINKTGTVLSGLSEKMNSSIALIGNQIDRFKS
jgi:methyl-accepting chemotaxis protein